MHNLSFKLQSAPPVTPLEQTQDTANKGSEKRIEGQLTQPGLLHEFFIKKLEGLPARLSFPQQALTYLAITAARRPENQKKFIVWLGTDTWPTPFIIRDLCSGSADTAKILERCLLLNAKHSEQLIFAIKVLRSNACVALIANFERLDFSASRKIAIAAKTGKSIALISRSEKYKYEPSLAYSRWIIEASNTNFSNLTEEGFCLFEAQQQARLIKLRGSAEEHKDFNLHFKKLHEQETLSMYIFPQPETNRTSDSSKYLQR